MVAPATACTTNAQTVGLNLLSDVFPAALWVSNVAMMATSSVATHLALSLHFLLASNPGSLGTLGIWVSGVSLGLACGHEVAEWVGRVVVKVTASVTASVTA